MYGELEDCISNPYDDDGACFWYLESTEAHEEAEFYESLAKQEG